MIPLCWQDESLRAEAQYKARELGAQALPLAELPPNQLALSLENGLWYLRQGNMHWHPDWLEPARLRRYAQASLRREALARACGLKAGQLPQICDATAGMASDACLLAVLGCSMQLLEAHPVVALLLQQAREQASKHPQYGAVFASIQLECRDSVSWLAEHDPPVVYLDPMFSEGDLKAQVSKPMQLLRLLHREWPVQASDASTLLQQALQSAGQRVVVKRARRAAPLAGVGPHHEIGAGNCRFDVYMKN